MTSVLEVLLELECLKTDLAQHPLRGDSASQLMILLRLLVDIMTTILKDTISKDSLAELEMIRNGDTI